MTKLPARYRTFKKQHAKVWKAYDKLGATAGESGPLDLKTRELIKLGMAGALRAESAVKSHTHRALEAGATPDEINHALIVGVNTIGFPSMMTAWCWAQEAMDAAAAKD